MIKPLLEGHRVLVCRPEPAATELCKVLDSVGAITHSLPCIEIRDLEPTPHARSLLLNLDEYSKVIVVSQHAASRICDLVDELWPQPPQGQTWYGIGRKSTQILSEAELNIYATNADMSSEALLDDNSLENVKQEKILIVKGKGGRSALEQGLRERGALVNSLELYERVVPSYPAEQLQSALIEFDANCIIALSSETLENFHAFAKSIKNIPLHTRIILPSERVARYAKQLGFKRTQVSQQLRPIEMIRAIALPAKAS